MGNFSQLPSEIMLDIFSRLPTELVLDCKLVSKTWRKVVRRSSFSRMHSSILLSNLHSSGGADSGKLGFIFRMGKLFGEDFEQLYYVEYDDKISSLRVKKLNLIPSFVLYTIHGSCNGLFCLSGLPCGYSLSETSTASYITYICNPITREVINLPILDRRKYYDLVRFMWCGFGYVASTNEYKVVRMYTYKRDGKVAYIDVYTLGSGKGWRSIPSIRIGDGEDIRGMQDGVFANGIIYWDFGSGRTAAFNLADEILLGYGKCGFGIDGVLGGHLCGRKYNKDGKSFDVWLLKENWSKEFSFSNTESDYTSLVALTNSGTVLCYSDTKLHLYDLKSRSTKLLEDFGRAIDQAIPHVNTLVSLKAFGEENMRKLKFGESAIAEAEGRGRQRKRR